MGRSMVCSMLSVTALLALLSLKSQEGDAANISIALLTNVDGNEAMDLSDIEGINALMVQPSSGINLYADILPVPTSTDVLTSIGNACQRVSSGEMTSVVSLVSCDSLPLTSSFLKKAAVPHVLIHPRSCPVTPGGDFSVSRQVGRTNPVDVIQEIVMTNGWTDTFIYYDSENIRLYADLMSRLSFSGVSTAAFEIGSDRDISNSVPKTVRLADYAFPYIILCEQHVIRGILEQAKAYGLREYEFKWIVYTGGILANDLVNDLIISDNIIMVEESGQAEIEAELKMIVQESLLALYQAELSLIDTRIWNPAKVIPVNGRCMSPYSISEKLNIITGLQVTIPTADKSIEQYNVQSSIQRFDATPHFEKTGDWTDQEELETSDDDMYINSFGGFNGRHFIFGSIEYSFFQFKEEQLPNGHWRWNGLVFELMDELAKVLNFTYETIEVPDGAFGIQDGEGNWNGLIGMVHRKEIDIAASVFSITAQRKTVVDFCSPIFYEESAVILRQPEEEDKLLLFFRPYKWQVWATIISSVFLCGISTWLVTMFSPLYKAPKRRDRFNSKTGFFQLRNTIMYFYAAFVQQGGIWLPLAQSGRILVGCFWFSCLVLVATYTGNLISFLAVSRIQLPFNNLLDMSRQSQIRWGTPTGVALVQLFEESTIEPYASIAKGNDPSPTYTEGLRRVKEENYAFIAEKSWYHAEAAKDCRLAMLRETFFPTNYGMAFQKDIPYLKLFDEIIIKLKESGILKRWTEKWTPQNLNCVGLKAVTTAKIVSLNEFQGALYILCIGLGVAILTFGIENVSRCCRKKPEESKKPDGKEVEDGWKEKKFDGLASSDEKPPFRFE